MRVWIRTREHDFLSPFSVRSTTGSTRTGPQFKPMNAYSRYECFKSRQDYSSTSRYASGLENGGETEASSPGCIKTGCFIIFHIDKRGREEKSGEHDERTTGDGGKGWNGAGGEGLTAINFAKIGAYAVAGRQSNPSSAHYLPPPLYAEMGVQLAVGSSREKRRAAGGDSNGGSRLYFLQLSSWHSKFFFFFETFSLFFSSRYSRCLQNSISS